MATNPVIPEGFRIRGQPSIPAGFRLRTPEMPQPPEVPGEGVELEWKDVVKEALGNTPKSAGRFIENLFSPLVHPIQTFKVINDLPIGVVQKMLMPGKQDKEATVDALVEFMKSRYGSVESLKQTVATDPVGVVSDVATFIGGAGAAIRAVGAVGKIATVAKAGQIISKVGGAVEPVTAAKIVVGTVARQFIPGGAPSALYQSAMKFSTKLTGAERDTLTATGLEHKIMPTVKGIERIRNNVNDLNDRVTVLVDTATKQGKQIPLKDLFTHFRQLKRDALEISGTPLQAEETIKKVRQQVVMANKKLGRKVLTPNEAQALKQGIYRQTETYYSKTTENPVSIQAQQAIARAAKESLEKLVPELKQLNQREGVLIELRDSVERAAARVSNRDVMNIGMPLKGITGGVVFGPAGLAGGVALSILDRPGPKAALAVALETLARRGVQINPNSAIIRLGIYQVGRATREVGLGEE